MSTPAGGPFDTWRVDQVGSLLRPPRLKAALATRDGLVFDDPSLFELARASVGDAFAAQTARGVLPLSDGEFWRRGFQETFPNSVAGYAPAPAAPRLASAASGQVSEAVYVRRQALVSRLELRRNLLLEEVLADQALTDAPVKVTLTGPERLTQRADLEHSPGVYASFDAFMADVVAIEREMIAAILAAGCPYVQVDEPAYTAYVDPTSLEWMRERGWDPAAGLARAIAADNALIEGLAGATFGLHVCRGNAGGQWHREGAYDAIAEQLFSELAYPRLLLEYDTERAGGFEPLRFVPSGAVAVLGLVSTKTGTLETREELLGRIEAAARYCPIERLALSPQCGFASGIAGNPLSESDQWRKLELVLAVAEEVWGRGA